MATIDQTGNASQKATWARGDSSSREFTVKDGVGVAINITGFTFIMTVDTRKDPNDNSTNIFSVNGVITDGPNGKVTFTPTTTDTNQPPDLYYYDIQMIEGGGAISTLTKALLEIEQDITK